MIETIKTDLCKAAVFRGLAKDSRLLDLVAEGALERHFAADEYVFHIGEPAHTFYVVQKGKVAVEIFGGERGRLILQTIDEGDLIGWSWLIEPHAWRFDARCVEDTVLIELDGRRVRTLCEEQPAFGYVLLKGFLPLIAERLEATRLQLLDLYEVQPESGDDSP